MQWQILERKDNNYIDDEDREMRVIMQQKVTGEAINFMATYGKDLYAHQEKK